jgi:hypothetical protein
MYKQYIWCGGNAITYSRILVHGNMNTTSGVEEMQPPIPKDLVVVVNKQF